MRLNARVDRVEWSDDGVRAGDVEADAGVIAVPASRLARIDFDPALPADVAEPLGRVVYGAAGQAVRAPDRVGAPSAVMAVDERYWTWTATGAGDQPQPVVSCFAGSPGRWRAGGRRAAPRSGWRRSPRCAPTSRSIRTAPCSPHGPAAPTRPPPPELAQLVGTPGRTARLRGRASGWRLRRLDGGRDPQRARGGARPAHPSPGPNLRARWSAMSGVSPPSPTA